MKKWICAFVFLLVSLNPILTDAAGNNISHFFISVGEAIMSAKAENWQAAESALTQLKHDWEATDQSNLKEGQTVTTLVKEAEQAIASKDKELFLNKLTDLSHALVAYERAINPVDTEAQRKEFNAALTPSLTSLQAAIHTKDTEKMNLAYKQLLATWKKKEIAVREQSIPYYGQIETQMGLLRIAILKDDGNIDSIQQYYDDLSMSISNFSTGIKIQKIKDGQYSLQTLLDLLNQSIKAIDEEQWGNAVKPLEKFLTVWPSVEGEVKTRNGKLYSRLENTIPLIAGKLGSTNPDKITLMSQLEELKQEIQLLQKKSYTIWDASLIMLREGLEALLIISALIAFLRKAKQPQFQKWIWTGAFAGLLLSVGAALAINSLFSTAMAGANREMMEGITGLITVLMMIGVGIWLHQKSRIQAWNKYINTKMGNALSTGSVLTMAFISFLSIFREGAETIIFYIGMAPSISTAKLLTGIGIALIILLVFTFIFIKFSTKIPLGLFFKIATILIYIVAFKILGMSIHALQVANAIDTNLITPLPIIDWIGFFPTWETVIPQMTLLAIVGLTVFIVARKKPKQIA